MTMPNVHTIPERKITNEDLLLYMQTTLEPAYGDQPPPPAPAHHPLQYLDAWLILAALFTTMAMTSSYQWPIGFEGLVFIDLGLITIALVCNLTRDRTFTPPQWPITPPVSKRRISLRKLQEQHGVKPVEYTQ